MSLYPLCVSWFMRHRLLVTPSGFLGVTPEGRHSETASAVEDAVNPYEDRLHGVMRYRSLGP
jgi:hypothetical protein